MYVIDVPQLFCGYHRRALSTVVAVIHSERNALISISIGSIIILRHTCVYINNTSLHNYMATFTLPVFGIDNCIFFTGVSLECCLYESAMGVKPVFLTSNHSDSDQNKIKDGAVHKTESLITF